MLKHPRDPSTSVAPVSTHWVDRLALRVAARSRPQSHTAGPASVVSAAESLAPTVSRRRALVASAAFITGLTVDATRQPIGEARAGGVVCADQEFKDCNLLALEDMDSDLKFRVRDSALDAALAAVTADIHWQVHRNYCAHRAARKYCGPCETCDLETGNCTSTCEPPETCQNGECGCPPCYRTAPNIFAIGCDPVFCPPDEQCNPNTGQCEPACGGQTCRPGTACCSNQCVDLQSDQNNCGACGNICPAGKACCSGGCVDLQSDQFNCGSCGNMCSGATFICANGTCSQCYAGQKYCQAPGRQGTCCPAGWQCCPVSTASIICCQSSCCPTNFYRCGC